MFPVIFNLKNIFIKGKVSHGASTKMHLSLYQVLVVALLTLTLVAAAPQSEHHVFKRSFFELQCKGVYDAKYFNRLARICEDCYTLFREASLLNLCKKDCFTSEYFKGCVEVLQETDDLELFKSYIKQLHGADPGI